MRCGFSSPSCLTNLWYSNCCYAVNVFHLCLFVQAFACPIFVLQSRVSTEWPTNRHRLWDMVKFWLKCFKEHPSLVLAFTIVFFELAQSHDKKVRFCLSICRVWANAASVRLHYNDVKLCLWSPFLRVWFDSQKYKGQLHMLRLGVFLHATVLQLGQ